MENRTEIQDELQSLSPLLAGMDKMNVFIVPEGYFESVSPTVLACIKETENNLPAGMQNTFEVPQGYFDTLAGTILEKIKTLEDPAEELKLLSPALASISKENIFEIPKGYFEQLPQSILQKVKPVGAKVVYMKRRPAILRYAVAAVITGVMALGVYKYANTPLNQNGNTNNLVLAKLDPSIEEGQRMNETAFNTALENLSEEAIAQYLVKNGDETDIAVLTTGIEENSLPSQEDYLLDVNTLENYLKEIEPKRENN